MARTQVTTRRKIRDYPYSLKLNGSTQFGVTAGNIAMSSATKLTVIAWIKVNALTGITQVVLGNYDGGQFFEIHFDNVAATSASQFLGLIATGSGSVLNYSSTSVIPLGVWNKIAMVYDGSLAAASRVKMYVNGQPDSTNKLAGNVTGALTDQQFTIGIRQSSGAFYSAINMAECVVIPGVAATDDEILGNYLQDTLPGTATVNYQFTDGTGATVTDSSGNADNCVFVNTPTWTVDTPGQLRPALRNYGSAFKLVAASTSRSSIPYANIGTSVTYNVWLYPDINSLATNLDIVGFMETLVRLTPTAVFYYPNTSGGATGISINVPKGRPFMLTVTQTTGDTRVYVDGLLAGKGAAGAIATTNTFNANNFGYHVPSPFPYQGFMDEGSLHSRILTAEEIRTMYLTGVVPTTNLERYYKWNEGSTTATDYSGNGQNGTVTAPLYVPSPFIAPRFSIRSFPYAQKFVKASATRSSIPYVNIGTTITLGAWIVPDFIAGQNQDLLVYGDSLMRLTNSTWTFFTDGNVGTNVTGSFNFENGKLYHVVVTASGTTISFYINGVLISVQTAGGGIDVTNVGSFIGYYNVVANPFNGLIAEYVTYSRALTAAEIAAMYFQNVVSTTNLEYYYKFATGSGTTATDSSGNARDGTITAGTWVTGFFGNRTQIT